MKHQKKKKIWSTRVQMQSRSSKGSVWRNSCSFLLLLVCSAKDSLLRKAQHEWLSLDFILVHGHASFYSERGAERHSGEKPGWSSIAVCLSLTQTHKLIYTHSSSLNPESMQRKTSWIAPSLVHRIHFSLHRPIIILFSQTRHDLFQVTISYIDLRRLNIRVHKKKERKKKRRICAVPL